MAVRLDTNLQYPLANEATTSNQNDYVASSATRFSGGGAPQLTGIVATTSGRMVVLTASAGSVTAVAESASSSAANRFTHARVVGNAQPAALFFYDAISTRWRPIR